MQPVPGASTLTGAEFAELLRELGEPAWREKQIRDALWRPDVSGFAEVLQLPVGLRESLAERLSFASVEIAEQTLSDSGRTIKLLCRLFDGQTVEAVAMETPATDDHRRRATVCVSSQVGCAVGCPFCATGQMGLRRHCTAAEIVDQVRMAAAALHARDMGPVTHVVYMGMGEPLANYDAVVASLRTLTGDGGLSARRITVSTSGVAPAIDRLATEGLPVTLAMSLHAATDDLRDRLVPLNQKYPLAMLIEAGMSFADVTGRRLSFEWCLIGGINDSDEQADGLRDLAFRARAHVNVIPMNHIDGSPWGPPEPATTKRFLSRLSGVRATVRDTRGSEADAACGQLRASLEKRRSVGPDGRLTKPTRLPAS